MRAKQFCLGVLAFCVAKLLTWSLRIKVDAHAKRDKKTPYLFAFWHGKQFLPVISLIRIHHTEGAVLVSPSKDGDILSTWLNCTGYETLRGSSRRDNISALVAMMKRVKRGHSIGFGIDGPLGPIYRVKPGMTHMAQKLNVGIVPIGSAFSRKWIFKKAWDRFELPKPFSRAAIYLGEPIYISDDEDLELANRRLENAIQASETIAASMLNKA